MRANCVGKLVGSLTLLIALGAEAGEGLLDKVQRLRSESFRACASVLLNYDPYSRKFNAGKSDEYATSLEQMAAVMGNPGLSAVKEEYAAFSLAIQQLESKPKDVPVNAVNDILLLQERLVAAANAIYAKQLTDQSLAKSQLHELSIANGKMLLMYQIRPYGGMVSYPGIQLNDEAMSALDAEILTGLDTLRQSSPDSALEIDAMQRNYEFVRPRIFDAQKQFVAHGVNYYLGKNIDRLDTLAARM